MKIMIIGSMKFAKEMVALQKALVQLGYDALIPDGTENHLKDSGFVDDLESNLKWVIREDIMRKNFNKVAEADAVLVVNHKRNGVDGFIGISALMEMAIAHHYGKKLFVLNPIPSYMDHRWAQEVEAMQPVILDGDLKKIN